MTDLEWLVDKLLREEYVEDGPELEKDEQQQLLDLIAQSTDEPHMLIININIESDGIYYDYLLDKNNENTIVVQEWDNRYL